MQLFIANEKPAPLCCLSLWSLFCLWSSLSPSNAWVPHAAFASLMDTVLMARHALPTVAMVNGSYYDLPISGHLLIIDFLCSNIYGCNCEGGCRQPSTRSKNRSVIERSSEYVHDISLFILFMQTLVSFQFFQRRPWIEVCDYKFIRRSEVYYTLSLAISLLLPTRMAMEKWLSASGVTVRRAPLLRMRPMQRWPSPGLSTTLRTSDTSPRIKQPTARLNITWRLKRYLSAICNYIMMWLRINVCSSCP